MPMIYNPLRYHLFGIIIFFEKGEKGLFLYCMILQDF
jgi:hypothetical protein